ncbi:hypothetical protein K505DRAFT_371164 [Melanomma pulvis-pyrius CBS 109.77]|uniref:DNA-binding protein RAP1 n=1 Tax=Melanomma pulvis-pyrius CBS 109.77 TaxID=1314802 RepID=A0A6A6XRU3_9PLEO|nr:hypothetical protein K505DRAFT_371164 [Melanomma pulvis-pyrius CBS 109.77]
MAASIVYDDVAEGANLDGQLFAGVKFWVAQRVPARNHYLDLIKSNGGQVVALEKKADYLIADHFRKDCPPGSISFAFIDESIQKAELADPENYLAGPAVDSARDAGSTNRPMKGGRRPYTAEDDRILYKWVRDSETRNTGLASGNEIYKQLEAKYPQHPWQSWRDRFLKKLRDRPSAAFNIPDNAPPSSPSDQSAEQLPPIRPTPKKEKKSSAGSFSGTTTGKNEAAPTQTTSAANAKKRDEYTVDALADIFEKNDWETLYANVPVITENEDNDAIWDAWAETTTQTGQQWKQYFKKVVRPQWDQDSEWKREEVRTRFEERRRKEDEDEHTEEDEEKASYHVMEAADKKHFEIEAPAILSSEVPSSTVRQGTSHYMTEAYEKAFKRTRGMDEEVEDEEDQYSRQSKRPRYENLPPSHEEDLEQVDDSENGIHLIGSQQRPLEISSRESSSALSSQDEIVEEVPEDQDIEDIIQKELQTQQFTEGDSDTLMGTSEPEEVQTRQPKNFEPPSSSNYPSNTPTPPGKPHQIMPAFDTQAILSSPIQSLSFQRLPRPPGMTQLSETLVESQSQSRSSSIQPLSPFRAPESIASPTDSLEEFRRSLNGAEPPEDSSIPAAFAPISHPSRSPSPVLSNASTENSGDPDPPLAPSEFEDFFEELHLEGFNDVFITAALKHTRCRPDLATVVLHAWKVGEPLPNQRGIWSKEDDEDVESGDGLALAKLVDKHTLDGWGGVTERLRFLEQYRIRN